MRFISEATNTRGGKVSTGIRSGDGVHTHGWDAGVRVTPRERGHDEFDVYLTGGTNGKGGSTHVGTVKDLPGGPRWDPADKPGVIPAHLGVHRVIAAIPVQSHLNETGPGEYACVVHASNWPSGEARFALVTARRNPDGTGWVTDDHVYGQEMSQTAAVTRMVELAGHSRPPCTRKHT